jgi:hypothetical protein
MENRAGSGAEDEFHDRNNGRRGMSRRNTNTAGIAVQQLSVELPVEVYRALRIAAAEENVNLSKLVRRLLDEFLATRYGGQQRDPLETSNAEME